MNNKAPNCPEIPDGWGLFLYDFFTTLRPEYDPKNTVFYIVQQY